MSPFRRRGKDPAGAGRRPPQGPPPPSKGGTAIQRHIEAQDGPAVDWFQPRPSKAFSGRGPVEAVAIHRVDAPDHWHLVTFGLTELHEKESDDRHVSGWGFELTLRVEPSEDPPYWAVDFLASLAAYVWSGQHPFAAGHLIDLRGPIRMDSQSSLTSAMVVADPVVPPLAGPFGALDFLQVVGLTADELELCRAWNPEGVREILSREEPLLITRLGRTSLAGDPRYAAEIAERMQGEGSSLHELRVATLAFKPRSGRKPVVQMGAGAAAALGPALRRELIGEEASFTVIGDDGVLQFHVADVPGWRWTDRGLDVSVPLGRVGEMAGLFDGRTGWGHLDGWSDLRFRVVR